MKYVENIDEEWRADQDPGALRLAVELREIDPQASIDQLKKLAELGSSLAMTYIGDTYANGRGLKKDKYIGVEWYRKAAANGSVEGGHRLAFCYYHMDKFQESIEILRGLSQKQFSPATYCLGLFYFHGVGIEKSLNSAIALWEIAEKQGHLLARRKMSFVLRSGVCGFLGRIRGVAKMFLLIIPYIRLALKDPRSDLLREW